MILMTERCWGHNWEQNKHVRSLCICCVCSECLSYPHSSLRLHPTCSLSLPQNSWLLPVTHCLSCWTGYSNPIVCRIQVFHLYAPMLWGLALGWMDVQNLCSCKMLLIYELHLKKISKEPRKPLFLAGEKNLILQKAYLPLPLWCWILVH